MNDYRSDGNPNGYGNERPEGQGFHNETPASQHTNTQGNYNTGVNTAPPQYGGQPGGQVPPQAAPKAPQRGQVYAKVGGQYDDSYNYDQKNGRKKRKGMVGIIVAVALAGVITGAAVMGFILVPLFTGSAAYMQNGMEVVTENNIAEMPEYQQTPVIEEGQAEAEAVEESGGGTQGTTGDNPVVGVAEQVSGSVVGVTAYARQLVSGQEPQDQAVSAGTGFVIEVGGQKYIITNSHVVTGGNHIKITTEDEEYTATVKGYDSDSDLAVLEVEGLNLPAVNIGDSSQAKVGELVVAIGNPLGQNLSNTVTVGYLSSVAREVVSSNNVTTTMLQTDAAINPGNSGGPLVNANGEVIGITTQKSVWAGVDAYGNAIPSEGIGFAIPISDAMEIVHEIIETGSVEKVGIGISYEMITAENAELWGLPQGALIGSVTPGSPAYIAGIREYDVILEFDGVDLTVDGAQIPVLSSREVGETVSAKVWRDGKVYDIEITLGDLNKLG